jgi:hypothetical protein
MLPAGHVPCCRALRSAQYRGRVSVRLAPDVRTAAALFAAAPYSERIASVIVGTGGAAGSIQLGEPLVSWLLDPDKCRRVNPPAIINAAVRGSTYHHFPDGKREMYAAALDLASGRAFAALEGVRGRPAAEVVEAFFAMWRGLLTTRISGSAAPSWPLPWQAKTLTASPTPDTSSHLARTAAVALRREWCLRGHGTLSGGSHDRIRRRCGGYRSGREVHRKLRARRVRGG